MHNLRNPVPLLLIPALLFLSGCQKKDESPPAPKAPTPAAESAAPTPSPTPSIVAGDAEQTTPGCCTIVANAELKGRLGRLSIAYPGNAKDVEARMVVYKTGDGKTLSSGYGNQAVELLPGTYDVAISGNKVVGVTIQSGHETQVKVGVLHLNAGKDTRAEILDSAGTHTLVSGYGEKFYGMPIGRVQVKLAGQAETVSIQEGQVTEF